MAAGRTYANPRNTAAGALRQLDPRVTAHASDLAALLRHCRAAGGATADAMETLLRLEMLGFPVAREVQPAL